MDQRKLKRTLFLSGYKLGNKSEQQGVNCWKAMGIMETSSKKAQGIIIFIVVCLVILTGCGTRHYKQFDLSNVSENQGVIIGKIDIQYNYRPFDSTGCRFCAGSACQYLLDDGYVFMSVEKGPLAQGRLSCSHPDIFYTVESFEVGSDIIYFGNLFFTVYDTSPDANTAPVGTTRTTSLIPDVPDDHFDDQNYQRRKMNGEVTSHVDDFGKAVIQDFASWLTTYDYKDTSGGQPAPYLVYSDVSVKDGMSDVLEVFRTQVKNKNVKVRKNIFKIKLEEEATIVYR